MVVSGGARSLDAALESCAAAVLDVVKTLRNVTGSLESEIESAASSPQRKVKTPRRRPGRRAGQASQQMGGLRPVREVAARALARFHQIDENTFKCADQVQGVVPTKALRHPRAFIWRDHVVFDCSSLPDAAIVEGPRSTRAAARRAAGSTRA